MARPLRQAARVTESHMQVAAAACGELGESSNALGPLAFSKLYSMLVTNNARQKLRFKLGLQAEGEYGAAGDCKRRGNTGERQVLTATRKELCCGHNLMHPLLAGDANLRATAGLSSLALQQLHLSFTDWADSICHANAVHALFGSTLEAADACHMLYPWGQRAVRPLLGWALPSESAVNCFLVCLSQMVEGCRHVCLLWQPGGKLDLMTASSQFDQGMAIMLSE